MQLNQYNLYSYNADIANSNKFDEVDQCKQELLRITKYDDVKNFIQKKFGEFDGKKWIAYPELNKYVYLYIDQERVEFCALKDKKQYFGRGWLLENIESD